MKNFACEVFLWVAASTRNKAVTMVRAELWAQNKYKHTVIADTAKKLAQDANAAGLRVVAVSFDDAPQLHKALAETIPLVFNEAGLFVTLNTKIRPATRFSFLNCRHFCAQHVKFAVKVLPSSPRNSFSLQRGPFDVCSDFLRSSFVSWNT